MLIGLLAMAAHGMALEEGHDPSKTRFPARAQCGLHLIEIAQRIQLYAAANDGMLPLRLSQAYTDIAGGGDAWQSLICPAARPELVDGRFQPSYHYVTVVPGGRKLEPKDVESKDPEMLVFDAAPVHQKGRNVLFSDMEVRYVPEAEFQELLASQTAKWAKREGVQMKIEGNDVVALDEEQQRRFPRPGRSFTRSIHFKITLGLVLAIVIVLVLLLIISRRRRPTPPLPDAED
jgi:hypothetical protein